MWQTGTILYVDVVKMEFDICINGIIFYYCCDEGSGLNPRNPICFIYHYYIKRISWSAELICHLQLSSAFQIINLSNLKKAM